MQVLKGVFKKKIALIHRRRKESKVRELFVPVIHHCASDNTVLLILHKLIFHQYNGNNNPCP